MYQDDVLVQENAIERNDLKLLMDYVQQAQRRDSLVSNFDEAPDAAAAEWVINKNIRDTQEVQLSESIVALLARIERSIVATYINPFYAVEVRDSEPWQILSYGVGGHYIPHVDAETLYKDESGLDMWEKTLDRDVSVVCFLNEDFEGGELVFPEFGLTVQPKAGTLVCFPSDHNFIHGVNPVRVGTRFTAVTWMRVVGMPTPDEINDEAMAEYHRNWPRQIEQRPRVSRGGLRTRKSAT